MQDVCFTPPPHSIMLTHLYSAGWEIAAAGLLLSTSLICLPAFSLHCLSCSHRAHRYTSFKFPESFSWGLCKCAYVCSNPTKKKSLLHLVDRGLGVLHKVLFLLLLVIELAESLQKVKNQEHCCCSVKTLSSNPPPPPHVSALQLRI